MSILVTCECGKRLTISHEHAGTQAKCPGCGRSLKIPGGRVAAYDVFISYSHVDKPTADALCATLERNRIRCWIAPRDILPGKEWAEAIIDGISRCRVMVLIFSSSADNSTQCRREVERAIHHGLVLVPFRIEDVPPSGAMEYYLSSQHWLDALTPPLQEHLDGTVDTLQRILGGPGEAGIGTAAQAPAPAVAPPPPVPVTAPVSAPPAAAPASTSRRPPLARDARALCEAITTACGMGSTGYGMVKIEAAERFFGELDAASHAGVLEGSETTKLNDLVRILGTIATKMAGRVPASLSDLEQLASSVLVTRAVGARADVLESPDAEALRSRLTAACGTCSDGSGHPVREAFLALFEGMDPTRFGPALEASSSTSVAQLLKVLNQLASDGPKPTPAALTGLIGLAMDRQRATAQSAVATLGAVQDVSELGELITSACGIDGNGRGTVNAAAARQLFEGIDAARCQALLEAADVDGLSALATALERIAAAVGPPRPASLTDLRRRTDEQLVGRMGGRAGELADSRNAAELQKALTSACGVQVNGIGTPLKTVAKALFDALDPAACRQALEISDAKSLRDLDLALGKIEKGLPRPTPPSLTQLRGEISGAILRRAEGFHREAVACGSVSALQQKLIQTWGWLVEGKSMVAISSHGIRVGSEPPNVDAARRMFDGLPTADWGGILAGAEAKSLSDLSEKLDWLWQSISTPAPESVRTMQALFADAITEKARKARDKLPLAGNADELLRIVTQACGVYADGSGRPQAAAVKALFTGFQVGPCRRALQASDPKSIEQLSVALGRIRERLGPADGDGMDALMQAVQSSGRAKRGWLSGLFRRS
ncbi:MAG: toll/interleukin-1 receptor domain-containing protein [Lentisphaeria bacterium]|nr:toll/interleukin-1 receptor domain-containing protein [Lentisphaeria bacterium]